MTSADDPDRKALAAELAMGLLDGEERDAAERLARRDPQFAAEVTRWSERLAPLLDEVSPVPPPAGVLDRVLAGAAADISANDNGKLRFWRGWSVGSTAVAAALALFLVVREPPAPPPSPTTAAPLVAAMSAEGSPLRLVATWDAADRSLVVAAATAMQPVSGHSHELWVQARDGTVRSLGLMPATGRMHGELPPGEARLLSQGAILMLSVEPAGGSTSGKPSAQVVAEGRLETS